MQQVFQPLPLGGLALLAKSAVRSKPGECTEDNELDLKMEMFLLETRHKYDIYVNEENGCRFDGQGIKPGSTGGQLG